MLVFERNPALKDAIGVYTVAVGASHISMRVTTQHSSQAFHVLTGCGMYIVVL
jgi:hypothetical protein